MVCFVFAKKGKSNFGFWSLITFISFLIFSINPFSLPSKSCSFAVSIRLFMPAAGHYLNLKRIIATTIPAMTITAIINMMRYQSSGGGGGGGGFVSQTSPIPSPSVSV